MRTRYLLPLLAVALLTAARPDVAIVNVNVVTMLDERVLRDQVVVVSGERIVAMGPPTSVVVPEDARIIDAQRGYLIPGLVDMHVHVYDQSDFLLFLANGVTTVRGGHGSPRHVAWRNAAASGELLAPTQFTAGPQVRSVETLEDAARLVGEQADAGYDFLKIYDDVSAEVYQGLVRQARRNGLVASGHIPRNLTWQDMLDAAPACVDHAEEFLYSPLAPEDIPTIAAAMVDREIALITTLTNYDMIARQVVDLDWVLRADEMNYYWPVKRREWGSALNLYANGFSMGQVDQMRTLLTFQKRLVRQLHEAGVTILMGTDAGNSCVLPGFSALDELDQLVDAGLTPLQALQSATVLPARFLDPTGSFGTIEVGSQADMVLTAGNPLEDAANVRLQQGVMVRGRWLSRDELVILLDDQVMQFGNDEWLVTVYELEGLDQTIEQLEALRQGQSGAEEFPVRREAVDQLARQILEFEARPADALRLFRFNASQFPDRWEVFDSLGDGYHANGDLAESADAYRRALRLRPDDRSLRTKLLGLSSE